MTTFDTSQPAATIDQGLCDWQVVQQDDRGEGRITVSGRWWTVVKRKRPQVHVRIMREGTLSPATARLDWMPATVAIDESITGPMAGKVGTWSATIDRIPRGGPYRIETMVGGGDMGMLWRRRGQIVHFFCVGDVWLIAGQSNACGCGLSPVDDPSEFGVHEYDTERGWHIAAVEAYHHPWLAFAKSIKQRTGNPVGLVPTAVGGTPISRWYPCETGDLYNNMLNALNRAGGGVKGVLWYQGESDAQPELVPHYKQRFARFVEGVREATRNPKLPVITVQINRHLAADPQRARAWEAIQECQRQLAREIEGVLVISIFESALCDSVHNGSLGNLLIAQRASAAALGGVYGHDVHFRAPECVKAVATESKVVELRFENVYAGLDYHGPADHDFAFAVRDESGEVAVVSYRIESPDRFVLMLARELKGQATVTGMPGAKTSHNVPRDLDGQRGMLAFTHRIETSST
jgi:hypothetical protein